MSENENGNTSDTFIFTRGTVVQLRRISPLLAMEVQKALPLPEPPLQEIELPDGKKRQEPNRSAPEYLLALSQREAQANEKSRQMIVKLGVTKRDLTEKEAQEVAEIREFWKTEFDRDLAYSDWEVFINFVAVTCAEDIEGLVSAILRRSQPTEGAIKQHSDSFRD